LRQGGDLSPLVSLKVIKACLDNLGLGAKSTKLIDGHSDNLAWSIDLLVVLGRVQILNFNKFLDSVHEPHTNCSRLSDDSINDTDVA
jgi:hypothetical protein